MNRLRNCFATIAAFTLLSLSTDILCVRAVICQQSAAKECPLMSRKKKLRIGIYAGVFDPVHAGHIAFALQARHAASLDQIIFLPERRPRHKPSVEHYAHRVAMLKSALAPHPDLAVMEIVDRHFTVKRMLPMLQSLYPGAELVFLLGSDAFLSLPTWQYAERIMATCEFVVGMRAEDQKSLVEQSIGTWPIAPPSLMVFESFAPHISSSHIRRALRENRRRDTASVFKKVLDAYKHK
jgi:nicotinate (nicotinamide) nucleotide adenylyltransferase